MRNTESKSYNDISESSLPTIGCRSERWDINAKVSLAIINRHFLHIDGIVGGYDSCCTVWI